MTSRIMVDPTPLTPQEKLAISRNAFVRLMARDDRPARHANSDHAGTEERAGEQVKEGSPFSALSFALQTWWRYHPAHAALDLARPLFDRYAARRPIQLICIALAVGAAAALIRPWRLVSVGGLLLAAVKSASTPGVLLSMLSTRPDPSIKKP